MRIKIEKLYKILRVVIFIFPAVVIASGVFLVLFPNETFNYYSENPALSKFDPQKDVSANKMSFGVFPTLPHRYIDLDINLKQIKKGNCKEKTPEIALNRTYQAFLYPNGNAITNEDELAKYLFRSNKSKYPNGSLLHLKPTDEVFLLSDGKKILFSGPEIFRDFGYSFDNLTEVDKATLDQFPDADKYVLLRTLAHPNGAIFTAYPSHRIYLVADGEKHEIQDRAVLERLWPNYFSIPVDDLSPDDVLLCHAPKSEKEDESLSCLFDGKLFSQSFGRYYFFSLKYPSECSINDIHIDDAEIILVPEKNYETAKNSLRNIFASVLNRYLRKEI